MTATDKIPVIAVLGPTASGKTSLAVELAKRLDGEIVSCDSMQIYKGMDIATAKPTVEEMQGIKHYLIDFVSPLVSFSVFDYISYASDAISKIDSHGKNVILCGGTGLYADSLLNGISFSDLNGVQEKRAELIAFYEQRGADMLFERLRNIDSEAALLTDRNNIKRVIRALEICECSGQTLKEYRNRNIKNESPYNALRLVIDYKDREILYKRINERVDLMVKNGLVEEARAYLNTPVGNTALQAIGYKELKPYFNNVISLCDALDNLKKSTRHYAKRQLTWFRRCPENIFLYADNGDITDTAEEICIKFLKGEKIDA